MSNPLLSAEMFSKSFAENPPVTMTMEGTVQKTFVLVGIVILSAIGVWNHASFFLPFILPIVLVAFLVALVVIFAPKTAPYLSPVYALLEGLAIGTISAYFEQEFPWIVIQAVSLTFATFLIMLFLYRQRIIEATERFKRGVIGATGGIAVIYLVSIIGTLSGWYSVPYIHESGWVGIGFSIFVVGIAAFNLILDFDSIEEWIKASLPKYMEWYASFGLLVTLVWLYLEILELLSKINKR